MHPDSNLYVVIGDIDGFRSNFTKTKAQNYRDGVEPDGRAGILRLSQDGRPIGKGILGDTYPLNLYYAYGIRNSFGIDFDPVTGKLWDTENGASYGDEINLVEQGFNSGYHFVDGKPTAKFDSRNLEDFDGRGKYSNPEFSWGKFRANFTVAPTAIKFLDSDKLGKQYKYDLFVADIKNGNIYHFDLNKNRTELDIGGKLKDKVADSLDEVRNIIFAQSADGITDMQVGPDGYLYFLSGGTIFRIVPRS